MRERCKDVDLASIAWWKSIRLFMMKIIIIIDYILHACLMSEYVIMIVFKLTYANKSKETKIHGKKKTSTHLIVSFNVCMIIGTNSINFIHSHRIHLHLLTSFARLREVQDQVEGVVELHLLQAYLSLHSLRGDHLVSFVCISRQSQSSSLQYSFPPVFHCLYLLFPQIDHKSI